MKRTSKKRAKAANRQAKTHKKQAKLHKKHVTRQQRRANARAPHRTITMKTSAKKGITARAGLVPVMKYLDDVLHFREVAGEVVEVVRGASATYPFVEMVHLIIVGVVGGANSLLERVGVCADIVFFKGEGWTTIPHNSALGRIFRATRERHIPQLETLVHTLRPRAWTDARRKNSTLTLPQRRMWIDCDSTADMVYGHQEGAEKGYNTTKKGALSYHPLLAFCMESKEILQGWFRCGSAYTSNGVVEFMKQLAAHLPPQLRLVFRGDSGFFVGALFDWLDERGDGDLVNAKLSQNVKAFLLRQSWTPVKGHSGWEQCEFEYQCETWTKTRRCVAVRHARAHTPSQAPTSCVQAWLPGLELPVPDLEHVYEVVCYVTTEPLTPWEAHTRYGQRATCETWIEEAKNQMGLGQIRTSDVLANAAVFHLPCWPIMCCAGWRCGRVMRCCGAVSRRRFGAISCGSPGPSPQAREGGDRDHSAHSISGCLGELVGDCRSLPRMHQRLPGKQECHNPSHQREREASALLALHGENMSDWR